MNFEPMPGMATLFDVVRFRSSIMSGTADSIAFTYLNDGENVSGVMTYSQLDAAAQKLAARLQQITKPGDRVLLVYPPSLDYIVAFYGCLYAGVVAVPALPPANKRTLPRLRLIAADAQPAAALTLARIVAGVQSMHDQGKDQPDDILQQLKWLATDDLNGEEPAWVEPQLQSSDIVFLQYTSGSTGAPKGVMVAHHNLLANLSLFEKKFDLKPGDVFVFWLPPHHDFGLIGSIIMPVYVGAHSVQFPPAAFLMRPYRWLNLISRYRARITGAPNFAYQFCVDKISDSQREQLDLSCLDIAMNGAERIRFESVQQFAESFSPCGFRPDAMTPSYGMAEFVLLACANMKRTPGIVPRARHISKSALESGQVVTSVNPADSIAIVSNGTTGEDKHQIALVDPVSLIELSEENVGEVWLRGPSVTQGYWGQDNTDRESVFRAHILDGDSGWLRTGDVGFLSEGELYITGRIKEVMIFNGRNIYPQDVEMTVEKASPAFRTNGCAAFALEEDETTRLVVVQEVESRKRLSTKHLIAQLRADIAEQHEILDLAAVVLVRPGHIPRTSSGKIQRTLCKQLFLSSSFDSIWSWNATDEEGAQSTDLVSPKTSTEERLLELWRQLFDRHDLSTVDNFFRLGGHSLLAVQLIASVRVMFEVDLSLRALFDAPTVAALASVIDCTQTRTPLADDDITPALQDGRLPLSFAQQRFWFLDQYQPANAFYAVPVVMQLSGELALAALRKALDGMVQRHATLRTIFPVTDGVPNQHVLTTLQWPLQVSDAEDLDAGSVDTQIRRAMMEEARKPFDLARGPLIRARLLNVSVDLHVLLLTLHHIVHDGWSVSVLIDELAQVYAAFKADQRPALPALPVNYTDYTQWEQRRYGGQNVQAHLTYWVEHLRGASPLLALPTDRPRPALMSHRGATYALHLPADLVRCLAEQAGQYNATLFTALMAAVQILLRRYCSQDDICMSVLSANRQPKTEGLIGAFVNVVPLRAQFHPGQTFVDVLVAATQEVLSAYERQLPFELILNRLAHKRDAAYTPYAQVVLNFHSELENQGRVQQHRLEQALQFDGRWAGGEAHTAFDLLLDVRESKGGLEVMFEYSTDLFDAASIQRWGTHLRHLLDGIAKSPDTRIDEFAWLYAEEREQVLNMFNATAQTWHGAPLVHQLFETQVDQQPDAIALISDDEALSYRSLNQRANQLAHALIAYGIGPDDRVAICVERSVAMVVGLLGILKAGGAYVPVDPGYPPERVTYMLSDSQPRLLLSSHTLREQLPAMDVPVLWLDDPSSLSAQPDHNPDPQVLGLRPDHLAYVIYTSGSTGQPKGAMNQHDGVVNRLLWAQQQFMLDANDRVLQKTPYAFDVSVWEFFLPLLAGAQLVMARPGGHQSPSYLAQWIASTGITVVHFVPSMLQVFLDQGDLSGCQRLRHVLCSGEALLPSLQNRFLQKLPGVALHNLYGPTEAAVDVTYWPCTEASTVVPIGRPIANTQLYVLDACMQPVPIGVAGELYIGGVQVGRGYLNRPALTEERFIANPFGTGRLYKTGDLGRWRVNGAIEYLGRNDFQVKLRGFRIELGEIEARLLEHSAIREAAVIAREDTSGDKRLVAYVVRKQQRQDDDASWDDSRVEQWRQLYQVEYGKALDVSFGEDFRTWNSSYDGQPIPLEQMREWRDATVARILALQPRRVLEIGCGSGLILSQLAPHCESYCGTDLSAEVVARLRVQVAQQTQLAARVSLHCQPAHSGGNLSPQHFDVIVINSVAQCFPSADYMLAVLHQAMNLLAPGGAIFLGDIRNLPLLPCLITAIQLARADATADLAALRSTIERELRLEQELVFDPDFFASLPNRIQGITGVDIRIKRGHFSNELSRYRYDVVLQKEAAHVATLATLPRLRWGEDVVDVASLSRHLQASSFAGLRLCGVPNRHLADEAEAVHAFEQGRSQDEVMQSLQGRHALHGQVSASLPHPEELHALGASLGLETIITWASQHGKAIQRGALDVLFVQPGQRAFTDIYAASHELRPLDELTTQPAQQEGTNQLLADLRDSLSGQLPDYMLPSAFVVLDALPLTPSGKLDRKALPAPDRDAAVTRRYESPQGGIEETIAAIWSGVLGLSPIGRHDHFFELGGHSLLATQVAAKLRASLSIDVPLKALFEHSTLVALAAHVQEQVSVASHDTGFDLPLMHMEHLSATPASFAQQRLWLIEQLDREQPVYTMTYAVRLRGELDIHALQASLTGVVARHESLRAHFIESHGVVMQHVADTLPQTLQLVDLSCDENGTLQVWMANAARQVFDLRAPPLIRLALLQERPKQHVLLISAHHIIADGWSLGIFNRELGALYNAHRHRQPSPLHELPFQYADFAHWQRQRSEQGVFEHQLAYWQNRLESAPAMLPLPTDRPRAAVPSHRGDVVRFRVSKAITHSLKLLVQRTEASLFMGLAAALATLLSRYTGQSDICIGTPVANRQHVALDDVIGFFVNTLVLRIDTDGSQSVDTLLRHARDVALDAYAHQEVPFDQVVASLDRARHDLHSPLFRVMLVLQNTAVDDLTLEHIEAEVLSVHNGTAKFDLTVVVTETDGELDCEFEYSADLFDHTTIARMVQQWERVLQGMTADPTQPVDRLALLDETERLQVVETFNTTEVPYPAYALIHQLFEQQALAHPDAIALLHHDASLSYGELNRRANRVAHALIEQGVGPDDRVAIGMERGIALIVGLLGILKAGGAYVPLDPAYPSDRLTYLLGDSAPSALLTQPSLQARWMGSDVPLLMLDDDGALSSRHSDINPDVHGLTSRHLAYVMYTSGSTGEPKGVMVEHRSVLRLVINNTFAPLTTHDVVVHAAKIAFDAATWEVWGGLLNGARVLLIDETTLLEPARFVQVLATAQATAMFLTVSLFNQYVDVLAPILPQFHYLLFGGEAADARTVRRVLASTPPQHLVNGYGPTETTTFAAAYAVETVAQEAMSLPIGRPIANTRVYILDRHGELVPVGVSGEIHVGGPGVARGYWNRPELTAERFLRDRFVKDPQARMYKTGDLGRWLANGEIEYLGRNDFQVKLRGYRIELGEIEVKLSKQTNVRDAVVIAREDVPGNKRLVAYLTSQDGQALSTTALRDALAKELAEYMLPSAFVQLEQLPLTPNGKLDRQALPAPDQQAVLTRDYEVPQGEIEQSIAAIWQELLGLERVGRNDHFFELGGHSLMAVQVIARLRQRFEVDLSLRDLFAEPTLQALAQMTASGTQIQLVPIPLANRRDGLPLSWAQQRLWFIHQLDPAASLSYHMPARLRLRGRLHIKALQATFERIAARHEVLRTRFVSVEGRAVQVIDASGYIPLVHHDLRGYNDAQQEAKRLALEEAHVPFDLSNGPLLRTRLLQLTDDDYILLLTQHHIVSDGWSIGVLVREISALYGAYCEGHPDPLPALPIQYADYAVWQREDTQRAMLQRQAVYWKAQLEGAPTLLSLPTDRPRPAVQSYAGAQVTWTLAPDVEHALRTLSQQQGTTLFMTALAAWSIVLSRWSGQGEVVIGTPVANRQRSELEPLLGFFVNTLALRLRLDDAPTVEALLARIKPQLIDAYAHQDLPFEQLVEALQPPRSLSHSPVFQVMLTMNNTPGAVLDLPGLRVEVLEQERTTAHFDVTLSLHEADGRLVGNLSYASDLFERSSIERMAQHFMQVLRGMSADVHQSIDRLPLLDRDERKQLLARFSASTEAPSASPSLIHTLFERQAQRTPDAIALRYEDQSLTYAQLNAQANRLAHALIDYGVKPDDRVALVVERSLAMVIGILGILKAGAGYVPLDPSYPAARLAYLIEDSTPVLLLTQVSLQGQWPDQLPVLHLDDALALDAQPSHNPQVDGLTAQHLAYVIYTSGTTGQPKGVMVEHAQVARLLATTDAMFQFGAHDVWTLFHSYAFDFSVWELWGALAYGGQLVIVSSLCARSPKDFYALLCREQVTVLNQTPSAFRALMAAQDTRLHHLRYVIFGGEALELHTLVPWIARNDTQQTQLINMYGITETTVHVTYRALTREDIETSRGSLVGRGLPDLQVYILDHHGEPVPVGVTGELHIGGAGVARGYWNRPQLTAERFLRDPFVNDPQARMYKSGDVGRWLPHGEIEYLGRNDAQVKIRGFRIELGEIEAKLLKQANVRDAVVIAREEVSGDKRLVAYLSTHDGQPLSTATLRDALAKELAEYMLPSAFVQLEQWPLTAHGKLDRQALPAPDRHSVVTRTYEAPQGKVEQAIATIWQELLGLERVGRQDHFFELGGHSLLAVQMMAQLRTACRADLPLRTLFDAPTVAMLAAEAEQAQPQAMQANDDIVHQAHDGILPLSFAQQRFWFLDQYQLENTFYNVALMVSLRGALDPSALEQAMQRMIERHGIFRTVFPSNSGVPQQVIQAALHLPWRFEDVGDGPEHDTRIRAVMSEEAQTPFDLAHGPLLRARLLRCHAQSHVLLLTFHHIVYDGWCTRILMNELSHAYTAFKVERPVALPELTVDYADYTCWEQRRYTGNHVEDDLTYWKAQLKEAPPLLALPTDRPRQTLMTHHGAVHRIHLPDRLIQRLTILANERHATLFMALTAITQMWLHRYCGQQDICIGVISASRPPGTEMLIGNFINILPLTTHIGETSSFIDLVDVAAKNLLAAYDRQLPFELILQHMLHEQRSAYIPYAQVVLNFHSERAEASLAWTTDDALSWHVHANDAQEITHAAFDLKLEMNQLAEGLEMVFEYNTDLFDAATIVRWSAHYQMLLESACAHPLDNVHHLNLLTHAEQQAFASAWRETYADYPRNTTIGELFDLQASRTPDAVAVVHRDRSLSYRELQGRADQLANFLRDIGVGPDTLVGIYTERSIEMVLSVLAVVKSGAAYVPLDPAYPQARLAHMLSDARPPVVLTQARLASRLGDMAPQIISVDALNLASLGDEVATLPTLGTPTNLAYVIYTSGSTGRPKGAMVHRQGFINLLHWYIQQFDIRADDKVLLLSSFSFDLTQKNIFSVLLVGGQLHLPINDDALSGAGDYIARYGITYLNCAPSAFYPLLANGAARRLSSLRQVFLGGEPIRVALIHDAYRGMPQVPLIHNTYGPTEASDVVSFHTWEPRIAVSALPIGRAIANTRLYVLDAHRQLLPQGAVGELYIGGDGVGRGYLHLAELTEERFLSDPYSDQPNARMYRTGDVVRQMPNGEIEYLGRNDFQVKIRGFRIELGEIEAKLAACAGVREAVVIAREDVPDDKRLVAYFTAHDGQVLSIAALRDTLSKELADYMLPSAFVQLKHWPLTPNGKLDRQALPAPDQQSVVTREYEAPQGEMEQTIASIWQQLLGLERVGRHDHFFELGGHSLLATQLVSRISAAFDISLPLRAVFESPTVMELAACATQCEREQDVAPIPHVGRTQALPLSFAQQRLWFLDQFESERAIYNIPAAVRLTGRLDVDALECTLNEIVQRHEALRTSFVLADDEPVQVIAPMLSLTMEIVDLRAPSSAHDVASVSGDQVTVGQEAQLRLHIQEEADKPFNLAIGPLIRFRLIRLAEQEHVLLLTIHHIVSDGWSMGLVVREVAALYPAFMQGQRSPLPDLPIHYADFAHWQRQWLSGQVLERQRRYWKRQLADAPSLLALPTDRRRLSHPSYAGSTVPFAVPVTLVSELQSLGGPTQSTLFMTLCAAFNVLLARYANQTDVCIGTPIANRNRSDIEDLIGFFVNTLVLRTRVDLDSDFHTLLQQVHQHTLDAYAHQDIPFEQLVEVLQPERNTSYTPLFQVMLALHNTPMNELVLPGLSMSVVESKNVTAKFDLTLSLTETKAGLQGHFEYSTDLFDACTIERMADHFMRLLQAIVAEPTAAVGELAMLSEGERKQLLYRFNDNAAVMPSDPQTLHQLFEMQVARTPNHVAVMHEGVALSYAQLNRRANQLAHHLRTLGVGPDVLAGICMTRTPDMIVALLGVLKAGGAYVPLDPAYPSERIATMLRDAQPSVLLTQQHLQECLSVVAETSVFCIDAETALLASYASDNVANVARGDDLSYVIYTSGSTGKPKGVAIQHRNVTTFLQWALATFDRHSLEKVLASTSICFDLSIFEIFVPLCRGGSTWLVDNVLAFAEKPDALPVTLINTVPSAMAEVQRSIQLPASVKVINLAGEALSHTLVQSVYQQSSVERIYNLYGPSEDTTYSTFALVEKGSTAPVSIGRPIANTQAYILDARQNPVPIGVAGELFIAGDGLARGYLKRPELTAEKFVPNPFSAVTGARMYRTGDLVRYLQDGQIEYLGRVDHQVKIRGFRIELGEIEATLLKQANVRDAIVIAREDAPGDKRLVAYITVHDGKTLSMSALRNALAKELPEYMLPGVLVQLEQLPLTPNGKLDRQALAAPDRQMMATRDYEAPQGEIEQTIAVIWQELLSLERVGRQDHFFELGGHSLLAVRVITRLRHACHVDIPLAALFKTPELAAFAEVVLSLQVETFLSEDIETIQQELDSLSEEELLAILEKDAEHE